MKVDDMVEASDVRQWIGRTEAASDIVTAQLVKGLRATLFMEIGRPRPGDAAPLFTLPLIAKASEAFRVSSTVGGPPGSPVTVIRPLAACISGS